VQDRKRKLGMRSGGALLLAVTAASALALVFAGSGAAGVPAGQACNLDGQIDGGGATLQVAAQQIWIQGYTSDICGNVGSGSTFSNGVTNNTAVDYNLTNTLMSPPQTLGSPNGSGAGRNLASCRAAPFGGSDTPYDEATLTQLNGNPGATDGNTWYPGTPTECSGPSGSNALSLFTNPFYGTQGNYPFIGGSQALGDQPANLMSFPVTGTAVAVGVYFGVAGTDSHGCPANPQITGAQLSGLFDGQTTNWTQLGGAFANCFSGASGSTPLPVARFVRSDSSGTTQNFKNYLAAVDPSTVPACATANAQNWTFLAQNAQNTNWPTGVSCSPLTVGHISGNLGVLDNCTGSASQPKVIGAICYADLPDFENTTYQAVAGFDTAQLPAAVGGAFVKPFSGHRANCDYSGVATPGSSNDGAVGLVNSDNWGLDNSPSHANVANIGTGWPACAMTWDLVYSGLSQTSSAASQPNRQLNDDMRRTLYSYMLYILGPGQTLPTSDYYQSLPQGLLNSEIAGFKANY
jgi:ABC-type phosphate transport system substrate-binding protein